jgi:hypothetical protein
MLLDMITGSASRDSQGGAQQARPDEEDLDQEALLELWLSSGDDLWLLASPAAPVHAPRAQRPHAVRRVDGSLVEPAFIRRYRQRAS